MHRIRHRAGHGSRRRTGRVVRLLALALLGSIVSGIAGADTRQHRDDRYLAEGRVIDVRPVYAEVAIREPVRHCRGFEHSHPYRDQRPQRLHRHERPFGREHERRVERTGSRGAIVGGVIGGTVGNRIARHRSRDARVVSTVAGAIIGSTIGHGVARTYTRHDRHERPYRRPHHRPVERCRESVTTRYETRLQYYDVTYVFRGRTFHAKRQRDPGARIEIDVSRRPSDR